MNEQDFKYYSTFFDCEAKEFGMNEAIVIQKIRMWLSHAKANKTNFNDGKYWVYNTMDAWVKIFPWWGINTIRRTLLRLESLGLIVTGNYNKALYDRTKWYSLSDSLFEHTNLGSCICPKQQNPFAQNGKMDLPNVGNTIPLQSSLQSTLGINTNTPISPFRGGEIEADFEEWYKAYPRHLGRGQAYKAYKAARKKADKAKLLAGANKTRRMVELGKDVKFIKHPASWLNAESWLDDTSTISKPVSCGVYDGWKQGGHNV